MRAVEFAPDVDSAAATVPTYRAPGLFGNARIMRADPVDLLTAAHQACGDTVLIPILPGLRVYSFRHPDAVRDVLTAKDRVLVKGRAYAWFRRDVGVALLGSDGEEHAWRRAAMQPLFTRPAVLGYEPVIQRSLQETVRRWSQLPADGKVDVQAELSELTLRVIGEIMFGDDFTVEAGRLQRLFGESTEALGELIGTVSQAVPRWIPTPVNRRLVVLRRELEAILTTLIERRLRGGEARDDLLGQMTCPAHTRTGRSSAGPRPRAYRTAREILNEVKGTVGAGHETTANLLTWVLYLVATHGEVQDRLAAELAQQVGERPVTVDDVSRLPYVKAVVDETLRLMPPSWALLREATEPTTIGGTPVPAGSFVVSSPYVTQRDPRWFPEPLRFFPERTEVHGAPSPYAFFPFGRGPKTCIGKTLAEVEAQLIVAELVRCFRFRLDAGWFVQPITRVAVKPVGGLRLAVEPRREASIR